MKKKNIILTALLPFIGLGVLTGCSKEKNKKVGEDISFALSLDIALSTLKFKDSFTNDEDFIKNNLLTLDSLIFNKINESYNLTVSSIKSDDINESYKDKGFNIKEIFAYNDVSSNLVSYTLVSKIDLVNNDSEIHNQLSSEGYVFKGTNLKNEAIASFKTTLTNEGYRSLSLYSDLNYTNEVVNIIQNDEVELENKENEFKVNVNNDLNHSYSFSYTPLKEEDNSIFINNDINKYITRYIKDNNIYYETYSIDENNIHQDITKYKKIVSNEGNISFIKE